MTELSYKINGMSCGHCVMAVKKELSKLNLESVEVEIGSAKIKFDETKIEALARQRDQRSGIRNSRISVMKNFNLPVEGMTCASCVTRVEKIIGKFDGVKNVNVNLATEHVSFEVENDNFNLDSVVEAVNEYGYKLKVESAAKVNHPSLQEDSSPSEKDEYFDQVKKILYWLSFLLYRSLLSVC